MILNFRVSAGFGLCTMAGHMEQGILWLLSIIAALFVGVFLKSYMSKKAENWATHEDIQKLVDQVRAVTVTTEEIKASISTEAWKRDLKKEACYELLKQLEPVSHSLSNLMAKYTRSSPELIQEAHREFVRSYGAYLNAQIVVEMVGSEQLREALQTLTKTIMATHQHIQAKDFERAWIAFPQFATGNEAFMNACRTELGFDDDKAR